MSNITKSYKMGTVFLITMIMAFGGIVATISLTNTVFAKCGLGTQDLHCSGQNPPALGAKAGNFKCDFSDDKCAFSGNSFLGGGRCTGDLFGPTDCVGHLKSLTP